MQLHTKPELAYNVMQLESGGDLIREIKRIEYCLITMNDEVSLIAII